MVELNEEARRYLLSDDGVAAMMSQYGSPSVASTTSAVDYGVPLIVDGLKRRAEDSAGIVNLLNLVRSLDTSQLGTPAMWARASHRFDMGPDLLEIVFRDARGQQAHPTVVRKLAERARTSEATAHGILSSSVWMVLAALVNRYSRSLDRQTLLRVTSEERQVLSDQGWDPWIRSVEWEQAAVASNDTIFTGAAPDLRPNPTAASPSASSDRASRYPPPVSRGDRSGQVPAPLADPAGGAPDRGAPYGDPGLGGGGSGGYAPPQRPQPRPRPQPGGSDYGSPLGGDFGDGRAGTRHRPMVQQQAMPPRHTRPRQAAMEPEPRRWPIAAAAVAVFLLAAGAWWLLGRGDDGTETVDSADAPSVEETADAGDAAADNAEATTADAGDATTDTTPDPGTFTGLVTMEVPMKDIFTFDSTNATGTARITIDSNTGEACTTVTTTNVTGPYNSHIHLGAFQERGAIVVDWNPMNDGVESCVPNDLNDINAILSSPSEYYVEMHDVGGEYTIRGQVAEATFYEDLRDPAIVAAAEEEATGSAPFDTDPNQFGALVRFQDGALLAQGAVAEQAILDALIGSLEASGIPVINELRVEAGSPPPSGRFVANEGLTFPVGGDQLQGDNSAVLSAMAAVINANPGWKLTVVGHTDDTGNRADNLELSRRRAGSVRAALEEFGVSTSALKVAGFGPDQPIADNTTSVGRQRNRRIEFIIDPT